MWLSTTSFVAYDYDLFDVKGERRSHCGLGSEPDYPKLFHTRAKCAGIDAQASGGAEGSFDFPIGLRQYAQDMNFLDIHNCLWLLR